MVHKIVSGGQTGADRAGLDAAMAVGLEVGGWCPEGRLAEDGAVPARYPLVELPGAGYRKRTEQNVIDSDGTLVINLGRLSGGTQLTVDLARRHGKPCLVVQLERTLDPARVLDWLRREGIATLNVAGPRESKRGGIHAAGVRFLQQLLRMQLPAVKGV